MIITKFVNFFVKKKLSLNFFPNEALGADTGVFRISLTNGLEIFAGNILVKTRLRNNDLDYIDDLQH